LAAFGTLAWRRAGELVALRPTAVIGWQPIAAGPAAVQVGRLAKVPVVLRTSGPELHPGWSRRPAGTTLLRPATRRLLLAADAVVTKSPQERRLVAAVRAEGVYVVPNAAPPSGPLPRSGFNGPARLLAACQLERHKHVNRLLAALIQLGPRSVTLTVAGDGARRARLESLARKYGAPVTFVGRVPRPDLRRLYTAHDALVHAAAFESCSNSVLEAMAYGLPVVGTRTAVADLVEDGVTGTLAASADPAALADAVRRLLRLRSRWPELSRAAVRRAGTHGPADLVARWAAVLRTVADDRGGTA
jgi:glycosyltransferase involved in cell wall biosynthesis